MIGLQQQRLRDHEAERSGRRQVDRHFVAAGLFDRQITGPGAAQDPVDLPGDLAVEMQGGHRILSIPLEGVILRGTDETADQVAMFVLDALAAGGPTMFFGVPTLRMHGER